MVWCHIWIKIPISINVPQNTKWVLKESKWLKMTRFHWGYWVSLNLAHNYFTRISNLITKANCRWISYEPKVVLEWGTCFYLHVELTLSSNMQQKQRQRNPKDTLTSLLLGISVDSHDLMIDKRFLNTFMRHSRMNWEITGNIILTQVATVTYLMMVSFWMIIVLLL